jgi:hypothetical protein
MIALLAIAVCVAVLLHVGVCPMTVQILVLAAILWRVYLSTMADPVIENMTASDYHKYNPFVPPGNKLKLNIQAVSGNLGKAVSVRDSAGNVEFTRVSDSTNVQDDVVVLDTAWKGGSSDKAGVFGDFTVAFTGTFHTDSVFTLLKVDGLTGTGEFGAMKLRVSNNTDTTDVALIYGSDADVTRETFKYYPGLVTIIVSKTESPTEGGAIVTFSHRPHANDAQTLTKPVKMNGNTILKSQVTSQITIGDSPATGTPARMSRLLMWESKISDSDVLEIVSQGDKIQILKVQAYRDLLDDNERLATEADAARTRNPFGDEVIQGKCSSIKDWTKPNAIGDANAECWDEIKNFCEARPDAPGCECWSESEKKTDKCKKFMATMSASPYTDVSALQEAQVEEVMKQYNLVKKDAPQPAAAPAAPAGPAGPKRRRNVIHRTGARGDSLYDDEEVLSNPSTGWLGSSAAYDQRTSGQKAGTGVRSWWYNWLMGNN